MPFSLPLGSSVKTLFLVAFSQKDKEKNGNKEGVKENWSDNYFQLFDIT